MVQRYGNPLAGRIIDVTNDSMHNGFPGMCVTPAGDLLCVYRKSTDHNPPPTGTAGTLVTKRSTDHGATWSTESTVYTAPGGMEARDPTLATLSDGRVALTFFDYIDATTYTSYALFSSDDGATFSGKVALNSGLAPEACTAPLVELANGNLLAICYGKIGAASKDSTVIVKSTDHGATWAALATIANGGTDTKNYQEPFLLLLDNAQLLCMIRTSDNSSYTSTRSSDSGATWSTLTIAFAGGGSRPATIQMTNGSVLCQFRDGSNYFATRASWTRGASWEAAQVQDTGFRYAYGQFAQPLANEIACLYSIEKASQADADVRLLYLYATEGFDLLA